METTTYEERIESFDRGVINAWEVGRKLAVIVCAETFNNLARSVGISESIFLASIAAS